MKLICHFMILLGLFSSCDTKSYIYRKPVVGLVYDNAPLTDVSVVYDSLDVLSPRNIITNKKGRFVLPKIEIDSYDDFINSVKGMNSIMIIKKKGYNLKKIDLKKYDREKDTIDIGIIHLQKVNGDFGQTKRL